MAAGDRLRELLGGVLGLTAAALAAAWWLAAPAGASGVLAGAAAPAVNAAPVPAAAAPAVAEAARPVRDLADRAGTRPALDSATRDAADTATGAGAAVGQATETVVSAGPVRRATETGSTALPVLDEAAGRAGEAVAVASGGTARSRPASRVATGAVSGEAARLRAGRRDDWTAPRPASLEGPRAAQQFEGHAVTDPPGASAGATSAPGAVQAALERPSSPEPLPTAGGGASATGAGASFSGAGLALLVANLSLAAPALCRRLPSRSPFRWPSAFVPLLERPG